MANVVDYGTMSRTQGTWTLVEGIVLIVLGLLALASPFATAVAAAVVFPVFLLVKGIIELIVAFRSPSGSKTFWHAAFGIISLLAGIALFARPVLAGLTLVVLLIAYFIVDGVARILVAARSRTTGWGWVMLSGAIDLLLAAFLLTQGLRASVVVLGVLIGIDILAAGAAMIAVGASERTHATHGGVSPA
jgi:uncharacterized membrane protein HdeD (DUF308 family)